MAILEDLAGYLAANGHGTLGTDLFRGFLPDTPDVATCLYEYPGLSGDYGAGGQSYLERPRVQVLVRDPSYTAGRARIELIYRLLDTVSGDLINQVRYYSIAALQAPFTMGRDKNDRSLLACNFQAMKETST